MVVRFESKLVEGEAYALPPIPDLEFLQTRLTASEINRRILRLYEDADDETKALRIEFDEIQKTKFDKVYLMGSRLLSHPELLEDIDKLFPFIDDEIKEIVTKLKEVSASADLLHPFNKVVKTEEANGSLQFFS